MACVDAVCGVVSLSPSLSLSLSLLVCTCEFVEARSLVVADMVMGVVAMSIGMIVVA